MTKLLHPKSQPANPTPARSLLMWSKLMRREVGKSQLHFIKTVFIYINLTQTVTNTGNVLSFHPRAGGATQARAGAVRRRQSVAATSSR